MSGILGALVNDARMIISGGWFALRLDTSAEPDFNTPCTAWVSKFMKVDSVEFHQQSGQGDHTI
jgi:hypothetical protein